MKTLMILICGLALFSFAAVASARPLNQQQTQFINFMIPKIEKANNTILQQRKTLIDLYSRFQKNNSISISNMHWLQNLAKQYHFKKADFTKNTAWQTLLAQVDVIPTSLVLAQSINESAWGRSRFAKLGNNYFGQWCSAPGCGLIPKKRKPGSPWQVRKFNNAYESIASYLNNINSNHAYRQLRHIRFELRETGKTLDANVIAKGLGTYSQRGDQYITIMQTLINHYQLAKLVQNYRA